MSISMSLFSPPLSRFPPSKPHFTYKPTLSLRPTNPPFLLSTPKASTDNGGAGASASAAAVEELKLEQKTPESSESGPVAENSSNGAVAAGGEEKVEVSKFVDPRWISGTWDLKQFQKDGKTDWDAVIDAGEIFFYWVLDSSLSDYLLHDYYPVSCLLGLLNRGNCVKLKMQWFAVGSINV
ncbi:hypothetical protein OIU78_014170 [Salix suchowensis]|nr:hypothetical protein OIU78_014170 [Salix suchowensis]